jgi:lipopolysaccharide biosynthesis glycosyltransferase
MTEYESAAYIDADTFIVGNIDHMFTVHRSFDPSKHRIGVSRDIMGGQWLNTFNMGIFVVKPNRTEFDRLIKLKEDENFKFNSGWAEQGFLNDVYKDQWYEIGFEYNANVAAYLQVRDFWNAREKNIRIIHYTLGKPWNCGDDLKQLCDLWRNYKAPHIK